MTFLRWMAPWFIIAPGIAGAAVQTIREIQQAATTDPFQPVSVKVEGAVTWVDPSAGKFIYIQDSSGGIQVVLEDGRWPKLGDQVAVDGLLVRGEFAPAVTKATLAVRGQAVIPYAKTASGGGLLNGAYSCERVRVDGWVRSATWSTPTTLSVVLNDGGARITARISDAADMRPDDMIGNMKSVTGVAIPVKARGGTRQLVDVELLVPGPKHVATHRQVEKNPWFDPVTPLASAYSYRPGQTFGDRAHVRGQIVYHSGETAYLNDGSAGLAVRGAGIASFKRGDWIEAVGFTDMLAFLPVLSDAIVLSSQAEDNPIAPAERTYGELLDGLQHAAFVTVTGELLDWMRTPESTLVYSLRAPEGMFTAEIEDIGRNSSLLDHETGSTLEVSGVCLVSMDDEGNPTGFRILVPDASQVRMVKPAGFFTIRRLLILLSISLGILLLAVTYAYLGSRRNMRLRAEIGERRAVSAERSRLARDLHDTLEQGLTGIHLQLHSISPALDEASAETQERLSSVRSLVLQCHTEMRQSIWNLRSTALEKFDLGDALKRIADMLVLDSKITVELRQKRDHVKIPPLIEDNLLRIGQEALTNAVKHAKPTRLIIELSGTPGNVSLTIRDDGNGSDTIQTKPGHFGLVGMKERCARIGGDLKITRNTGGGCSVRVDVPLLTKSAATRIHEPEPR